MPGQAIISLKKESLSKIVNNREEEKQENHKISCHMAFQGSTIIHRPIQSLIKHSKAEIMESQGPTILHRVLLNIQKPKSWYFRAPQFYIDASRALLHIQKVQIMAFQDPTVIHRCIQSLTKHSKSPNYGISGPNSYP